MANKQQLMQDLRALAVQVRQGAFRKKDLETAQLELLRRLRVAQEIQIQMTAPRMVDPTNVASLDARPGLGAVLGEVGRKSDFRQALTGIKGYSVESIDAAIRAAARL